MPLSPPLPSWIALSPLHIGERKSRTLVLFTVGILICTKTLPLAILTYQFSRTQPTQINHWLVITSKPKIAPHILANPPGLSRELGGIHAGDNVHEAFSYYGDSVIILEDLANAVLLY